MKMQIKATMKYHPTYTIIANIKKTMWMRIHSCVQHCWWESKLYIPYGKALGSNY